MQFIDRFLSTKKLNNTMDIGNIVTHENPYHRRGASRGAIEAITEQGWLQIYWEEDEENQILPALRTYPPEELKLCPS